MPKPEKSKHPKEAASGPRSLSARAGRTLKDVDHVLMKHPDAPPQERAMAHVEQAKVSALLQLAEAIRETRRAGGPPA